jgi:hypothetical protein
MHPPVVARVDLTPDKKFSGNFSRCGRGHTPALYTAGALVLDHIAGGFMAY